MCRKDIVFVTVGKQAYVDKEGQTREEKQRTYIIIRKLLEGRSFNVNTSRFELSQKVTSEAARNELLQIHNSKLWMAVCPS